MAVITKNHLDSQVAVGAEAASVNLSYAERVRGMPQTRATLDHKTQAEQGLLSVAELLTIDLWACFSNYQVYKKMI